MVTKLIIARHGNTFNKGDVVTRVGGKTDLPLVESGLLQGEMLGKYLQQENLVPDVVYASPLRRAITTAAKAIGTIGIEVPILQNDIFTEIDYGIDENKPEDEVVARIGQDAIDLWNSDAVVPEGWNVVPDDIIRGWISFAETVKKTDKTILVVTSNGVARFVFNILQDKEKIKDLDIKLATGAMGLFVCEDGQDWKLDRWNVKPKDFVQI